MDMVWPGLAVEVRRERKGKHPWPHLSPSPRIHFRHGLPVEACLRCPTGETAETCRLTSSISSPSRPGDGDRWPDPTAGALAALISYRNLLLDQKFSSGHSQSHMPYPTSLRTQHSETPTPTVQLPSHQRLPELPSPTSVAWSFSSPRVAKPACSYRRLGQDGTTMIMPRTRSLPVRDLRFGGCARCSFHWCDPLIESLASEDDVG